MDTQPVHSPFHLRTRVRAGASFAQEYFAEFMRTYPGCEKRLNACYGHSLDFCTACLKKTRNLDGCKSGREKVADFLGNPFPR